HLAVTADGEFEGLGKGINHRDAHSVKTAGNLIAVVVKLTARMEDCHDDFRSRDSFAVHFGRNSATIVGNGNRLPRVNGDLDVIAVSGEGFVYGVIHQLEY